MVYRPSIDERLCFVLMPFKEPFNSYYHQIIKQAAADSGLEALRADDVYGTGAIIRDIWDHIWRARIIIADVTDKNPNVNYELGLCHAIGIPTILITKRIDDVPFDYRHRRCIVYNTEEVSWDQKLRESLRRTIENTLANYKGEEDLLWPYDTRSASESITLGSLLTTENPLDIVVRGTQSLKRVISNALGPAGLNVSVSVGGREQMPYKQGSIILQSIRSANPLEQFGIEQMRLIAREVSRFNGDGTKTAVLLAQSMLEHGNDALKRGYLPKDIVRGMNQAVDTTILELKAGSKPVRAEKLLGVAATAASDIRLGHLIEEAMNKVGKDGVIAIEESKALETELYVVEGMQFDRGYLSPYFITNPETNEAIFDDPYILIHERKLSSMKELLPLLEMIAQINKPLLIIAEDVEGEALATLVVNKLRGTLNVAAVKSPGMGDRRRATIEDIAILTGGKIIGDYVGLMLENIKIEDLGRAKRVVVNSENTTIVEGAGSLSEIEQRIRSLRSQADETASDYDRERIQERLAKLVGGVAVIRAGGLTEIDILDNKYRLDSAMNSARSAVEEGYLPGGGLPLFQASKYIRSLTVGNKAYAMGVNAVANALEVPIRHLIENAKVSSTNVLAEIDKAPSNTVGFNVESRKVEDLVEGGILDSTKMLRMALEIAFSYVKAMLQTNEWDLTGPDTSGAAKEF